MHKCKSSQACIINRLVYRKNHRYNWKYLSQVFSIESSSLLSGWVRFVTKVFRCFKEAYWTWLYTSRPVDNNIGIFQCHVKLQDDKNDLKEIPCNGFPTFTTIIRLKGYCLENKKYLYRTCKIISLKQITLLNFRVNQRRIYLFDNNKKDVDNVNDTKYSSTNL